MHTAHHIPPKKVRLTLLHSASYFFPRFSDTELLPPVTLLSHCRANSRVLSCRKRAASKSSNGSHKYKGNSKDLKPPDLWIHHERLELKPMDKSPEPNPVMTETPIPRTSQDITPADSGLESNPHLQQRRNSYRGQSRLGGGGLKV